MSQLESDACLLYLRSIKPAFEPRRDVIKDEQQEKKKKKKKKKKKEKM